MPRRPADPQPAAPDPHAGLNLPKGPFALLGHAASDVSRLITHTGEVVDEVRAGSGLFAVPMHAVEEVLTVAGWRHSTRSLADLAPLEEPEPDGGASLADASKAAAAGQGGQQPDLVKQPDSAGK